MCSTKSESCGYDMLEAGGRNVDRREEGLLSSEVRTVDGQGLGAKVTAVYWVWF